METDVGVPKKALQKQLISLKGRQHNGICDQCDNREEAYEAPWINDFLTLPVALTPRPLPWLNDGNTGQQYKAVEKEVLYRFFTFNILYPMTSVASFDMADEEPLEFPVRPRKHLVTDHLLSIAKERTVDFDMLFLNNPTFLKTNHEGQHFLGSLSFPLPKKAVLFIISSLFSGTSVQKKTYTGSMTPYIFS